MAKRGRPGLGVGEDNIQGMTPIKVMDKTTGKWTGAYRLQWRICTAPGKTEAHTTVVKSRRKNDVKLKAKKTAEQLRSGLTGSNGWKPEHLMADYIRNVGIKSIEENNFKKPLRPNSQLRYIHCLELVAEQMGQKPILYGATEEALTDAFKAIATAHGKATAEQAVKVTSRYVMRKLVRGKLATFDPLRGADYDPELPDVVARQKPKGGQALSPADRHRVVDYLLELDPAEGVSSRGGHGLAGNVATRRLAIDVTLVQATCGMRISEVRRLAVEDVNLNSDPITLTVTEEKSKTKRERTIPVMDDRVADRIRKRVSEATEGVQTPVFGAPVNPDTVWDNSNAQKAIKRLYAKIADDLNIPLLREVSSHVWRATLNSEWMDKGVSTDRRAAYLGHSEDMNRRAYTDMTDLTAMVEILRK